MNETPSGLWPTFTSRNTLFVARSTKVTVPLSRLLQASIEPSEEMSIRLFDVPAMAELGIATLDIAAARQVKI
jgi:hypothetical protein